MHAVIRAEVQKLSYNPWGAPEQRLLFVCGQPTACCVQDAAYSWFYWRMRCLVPLWKNPHQGVDQAIKPNLASHAMMLLSIQPGREGSQGLSCTPRNFFSVRQGRGRGEPGKAKGGQTEGHSTTSPVSAPPLPTGSTLSVRCSKCEDSSERIGPPPGALVELRFVLAAPDTQVTQSWPAPWFL